MRYLFSVLALGLLIAFHELGHLLVARALRIGVRRYKLGFGPPMFTVRRGETTYSLGSIPFGGSVEIHGMNPHEKGLDPADPRSFVAQRPWKRILIFAAGPAFNYLLAFGVLVALHLAGTHLPVPMTIGVVEPGSEAARAQLRPGDLVATVNGEPVSQWSVLVDHVQDSPGRPLRLGVVRERTTTEIVVVPRLDPMGIGRLGIHQQYVFRAVPMGEAVARAFERVNRIAADVVTLAYRLIRGKVGLSAANPIAMVRQASDAASSGLDAFLRVLVGLSVALTLFYLLPLPALDGGRILFAAFEAVTGRRINDRLETLLHAAGFLALVGAIGVSAGHDLLDAIRARNAQRVESTDAGTPDAGGADAGP